MAAVEEDDTWSDDDDASPAASAGDVRAKFEEEAKAAIDAWQRVYRKIDWKEQWTVKRGTQEPVQIKTLPDCKEKTNKELLKDPMSLLHVDLGRTIVDLLKDQKNVNLYGECPIICLANTTGMTAESFAERVFSKANNIVTVATLRQKESLIEMCTVLGINKRFMEYMAMRYPGFARKNKERIIERMRKLFAKRAAELEDRKAFEELLQRLGAALKAHDLNEVLRLGGLGRRRAVVGRE